MGLALATDTAGQCPWRTGLKDTIVTWSSAEKDSLAPTSAHLYIRGPGTHSVSGGGPGFLHARLSGMPSVCGPSYSRSSFDEQHSEVTLFKYSGLVFSLHFIGSLAHFGGCKKLFTSAISLVCFVSLIAQHQQIGEIIKKRGLFLACSSRSRVRA